MDWFLGSYIGVLVNVVKRNLVQKITEISNYRSRRNIKILAFVT